MYIMYCNCTINEIGDMMSMRHVMTFHRTCTQELTRCSFKTRWTLADNLDLKISHLGAWLLTNFTVHKSYWSAVAEAVAVIQLERFYTSSKQGVK